MSEERQDTDQQEKSSDIVRSMYDESFDISMEDLMIPEVQEEATDKSNIVKDKVEGAFKFCFLGAGQGGSRIAESFNKKGYERVAAINTAEQDLNTINVKNKLLIGEGGAGKDPGVAKKLYSEKENDIVDFIRYSFGEEFDRIFVCVGGGGGTGSGLATDLVKASREVCEAMKLPNTKVGMILTLPKKSEGAGVCSNAAKLLKEVMNLVDGGKISPLVIVDNERVANLYPNLPVSKFWDVANGSTSGLFHLFNHTAAKDSTYSSFDANDYKNVLDSGLIVFGASPVKNWQDSVAISRAVRENLKGSLLTGGIDLSQGSTAGAIVIGGKEQLDNIKQMDLDDAFSQLSRMLKPNTLVHRGIYSGNQSGLTIFTVIGGLGLPQERLKDLEE